MQPTGTWVVEEEHVVRTLEQRVAAENVVARLMRRGVPPVRVSDRLPMAGARMRRHRVTALAVLDGQQLVGVISERDVLRAVAAGVSTDLVSVAEYMREAPRCICAAADPRAAVRRMLEERSPHLPVISDGRVLGLLSATDLLGVTDLPPKLLVDERW